MNSFLQPLISHGQLAPRLLALVGCFVGFSGYAIAQSSPPAAAAQASASSATNSFISGRVRNGATGAFLEGAEVSLDGTNLRTFSLSDGSFHFRHVPPGEHLLTVSYAGLEPFKTNVRSSAREDESVAVVLQDSVQVLGAFTVLGQREGNAASINRQKSAANIVNVIATDAYGSVSDGNIGNFLQRTPGVSVVTDAGHVIGIGLRGIPPDQSAVSVDGAIMATAVSGAYASVLGDRAPPIDRLPVDFIKEIEVVKAPTPDIPANGLGGSANLKTKSAFDFNQSVTTYRAGMNKNLYRNTPFKPTGSVTYMNAFGDNRQLGVAVSATYHHASDTRDRVSGQRNTLDGQNTQFRLLDDLNDLKRGGISAKVEYKITPKTVVGADISYSSYTSNFVRYDLTASASSSARVADYNVVSRAQIVAGTTPRTTANLTAGLAPGYTPAFSELLHASVANQSSVATRVGEGYKYGVNFSTEIAGAKVKVRASYNPEKYDRDFIGITSTATGVGLAIDSSNPSRPVIRQTYGPSIFADADFSNYTAQYFRGPDHTEEEMGVAQLDAERPFATHFPLTLKTGLMWSQQHRTATTYRPTWNFVGADGVAGRNAATGRNDDGLPDLREAGLSYGLFNGYYPHFQRLNYGRVETLFRTNPSWFSPSGTSVSTRSPATGITETVTAAYVMGKLQVQSLQVVGGVRAEDTNVSAVGLLNDPRNPTSRVFRSKKGYRSAFPSLHFRYAYNQNFLVRASYSTSMARPSIGQLTATTTVDYGTLSITQGNAGLKPQYSDNYDISLEYYLPPAGVLSLGAFHKEISDYILNTTTIVGSGAGNGFDGNFAGYQLNTTTNAGGAKVTGAEFNYVQSLPFLPMPWRGFSISANYTKLKSEGTYGSGVTVLRNYVPWTANLALSYTWKRFEVRVAGRMQAPYLLNFNADPLARQYSDRGKTVDVNLQYVFRPWLKVYADVTNVFNYAPDVYTANVRSRVIISEAFGTNLNLGISGRF